MQMAVFALYCVRYDPQSFSVDVYDGVGTSSESKDHDSLLHWTIERKNHDGGYQSQKSSLRVDHFRGYK